MTRVMGVLLLLLGGLQGRAFAQADAAIQIEPDASYAGTSASGARIERVK